MTKTTSSKDTHTLKIERILAAPRSAVWRCWTEAELLKQWYCPKPWTVPEADFDVRPGGRMNCVMQGPEGERVEEAGCWLEIVPEQRLVFTDGYTEGFIPQPKHFMTGFVELSDAGQGATRMVWGARHATEEDKNKHLDMGFEQGWKTAAEQLEELAKRIAGGNHRE